MSPGTYTLPLAIIGAEPLVKICGLSTALNVLFHSSVARLLASNARSTPNTGPVLASPNNGIITQRMPLLMPFDDSDIMPPGMPTGGKTLLTDATKVLNIEPLKHHMQPKSFSPQLYRFKPLGPFQTTMLLCK